MVLARPDLSPPVPWAEPNRRSRGFFWYRGVNRTCAPGNAASNPIVSFQPTARRTPDLSELTQWTRVLTTRFGVRSRRGVAVGPADCPMGSMSIRRLVMLTTGNGCHPSPGERRGPRTVHASAKSQIGISEAQTADLIALRYAPKYTNVRLTSSLRGARPVPQPSHHPVGKCFPAQPDTAFPLPFIHLHHRVRVGPIHNGLEIEEPNFERC